MEKNMKKPHKYNVGDTLTVKIAAVHEVNGKPVYRISGIENVGVSEKALDSMRQDRFIPGETVYAVYLSEEEGVVMLDAFVAEDVGMKEIKLCDDWFDIRGDEMFKDQQAAEDRAVELAVKYGFKLFKGGLLKTGGR